MDLEVARKSLSKRSAFSAKKIAFAAVAALVFVAGVGLRASHYFGETPAQTEPAAVEAPAAAPAAPAPEAAPAAPPPEIARGPAPEAASPPPAKTTEPAPATPPAVQEAAPAPTAPAGPADNTAEQSGTENNAVGQSEQTDLPGAGMILVARKPVQVLASPSASAPAMYGFPAGRPFRVIGREGGFVQIKDLRSSASGWIEETALAAPPSRTGGRRAVSNDTGCGQPEACNRVGRPQTESGQEGCTGCCRLRAAPPSLIPPNRARRPGLFGRGGLFGGIFGNGN